MLARVANQSEIVSYMGVEKDNSFVLIWVVFQSFNLCRFDYTAFAVRGKVGIL